MPYARIPDELCAADPYLDAIDRHPAAGTLVLFGRSYAARESSDGFVPDRQLRRWITDPDARQGALDALEAAGLFAREEAQGGWQMTDYLDDNMSAAEYAAKRQEDRERQRRSRARRAGEDDEPAASAPAAPEPAPSGPVTDAGVTRDGDVTPGDGHAAVTPASSRERGQTQTQTQTPTAANAAAAPRAGAHEPASGGGDLREPAHADIENARTALAAAGFDQAAIDKPKMVDKINAALNGHTVRIEDWGALSRWLSDERDAGRCKAPSDQPATGLRYALNSKTQAGIRKASRAPAQATAPRQTPALVIPDADEPARDAWAELSEAYTEAAGDRALTSVLAQVRVLAVDGNVIELTAQPAMAGYVERDLLPSLRVVAARGRTTVRWVDPSEAANRKAIAA